MRIAGKHEFSSTVKHSVLSVGELTSALDAVYDSLIGYKIFYDDVRIFSYKLHT